MAPIPLPHPIPAGIPAPHQIQHKPTLEDVKSALTYRDRVNVQYRKLSLSAMYQMELIVNSDHTIQDL